MTQTYEDQHSSEEEEEEEEESEDGEEEDDITSAESESSEDEEGGEPEDQQGTSRQQQLEWDDSTLTYWDTPDPTDALTHTHTQPSHQVTALRTSPCNFMFRSHDIEKRWQKKA